MTSLNFNEMKLTTLQENILLLLDLNVDHLIICRNLSIKYITLSKIIKTLQHKNLIIDNKLSEKGRKMVHYINFRNKTISSFLNKINIKETNEIFNQMRTLDYKIIIALKNLC